MHDRVAKPQGSDQAPDSSTSSTRMPQGQVARRAGPMPRSGPTVGSGHDPAEREADDVADRVVAELLRSDRTSLPFATPGGGTRIRRMHTGEVNGVAYLADGRVASVADDGGLFVWSSHAPGAAPEA